MAVPTRRLRARSGALALVGAAACSASHAPIDDASTGLDASADATVVHDAGGRDAEADAGTLRPSDATAADAAEMRCDPAMQFERPCSECGTLASCNCAQRCQADGTWGACALYHGILCDSGP